jgi:hypothetical protein
MPYAPPPTPPAAVQYQQNIHDNHGNIYQGPIAVNINPPYDPAAVRTVYQFDGIGRKLTPGRIESFGNPQPFLDLGHLAETRFWKSLAEKSDAEIKRTDGKWIAPYAFKGIALIHLSQEQEGVAMLRQVKELMARRDATQKDEFDRLVRGLLPQRYWSL